MEPVSLSPEIEQILAPVAGGEPCGPSIRYQPEFLALRQSRDEDDPTLPMRDWERPLKKADWSAVARECVALLARSKDLQLGAWLMHAWVRQRQIAGFLEGTEVLLGLVERYWDGVHPLIEDGDTEARTAAFAWLNEDLPLTLRVHLPLMFISEHKPPQFNFASWEKLVVASPAAGKDRKAGAEDAPLTREQLLAAAGERRNLEWLEELAAQLEIALTRWDALAKALDDRLGMDAPSLGKVTETLAKLQRACTSLLDGRTAKAPAPVAALDVEPEPEPETSTVTPAPAEEPPMPAAEAAPAPSAQKPVPQSGGVIASREDAYRMLEAAAAFLERTEPHSPTPYLVKRAVSWGQMSLADLMQEIMREEGDTNRFFSMLGITPR